MSKFFTEMFPIDTILQRHSRSIPGVHDDCDWIREKQTRSSDFPLSECVCLEADLSPALSAVERGLATLDYLVHKTILDITAEQRCRILSNYCKS